VDLEAVARSEEDGSFAMGWSRRRHPDVFDWRFGAALKKGLVGRTR
jgi:hypothetical protein